MLKFYSLIECNFQKLISRFKLNLNKSRLFAIFIMLDFRSKLNRFFRIRRYCFIFLIIILIKFKTFSFINVLIKLFLVEFLKVLIRRYLIITLASILMVKSLITYYNFSCLLMTNMPVLMTHNDQFHFLHQYSFDYSQLVLTT